jgi:hypothetical protein
VLPAVALALAVCFPGPARSAPSASCPPPADSAPAGQPTPVETTPTAQEVVIACVESEALSEATFLHWHEVALAGEGTTKHGRSSARAITEQVMGFLLSTDWVLGEAKSLKIEVSAAVVRREFEKIRRQQFPRERDFIRFLRQSKQTRADLLMRVELDMLSARMQRKMAVGRGPRAKARALSRFIARFRAKWTALTYCAPLYAVKDCGHVQTDL